jgi:hypothetical protein
VSSESKKGTAFDELVTDDAGKHDEEQNAYSSNQIL